MENTLTKTCTCPANASRIEDMCQTCLNEYVVWSEEQIRSEEYYTALCQEGRQLQLPLGGPQNAVRLGIQLWFLELGTNWNRYEFEPIPNHEGKQLDRWP